MLKFRGLKIVLLCSRRTPTHPRTHIRKRTISCTQRIHPDLALHPILMKSHRKNGTLIKKYTTHVELTDYLKRVKRQTAELTEELSVLRNDEEILTGRLQKYECGLCWPGSKLLPVEFTQNQEWSSRPSAPRLDMRVIEKNPRKTGFTPTKMFEQTRLFLLSLSGQHETIRGRYGTVLLLRAIQMGALDTIKLLLGSETLRDITFGGFVGEWRYTPLLYAVKLGDLDVLRALVSSPKVPIIGNGDRLSNDETDAFNYALQRRKYTCASMLLAADPRVKLKFTWVIAKEYFRPPSAMEWGAIRARFLGTCGEGYDNLVSKYLSDVNYDESGTLVDVRNSRGDSALIIAIRGNGGAIIRTTGRRATIALLLKHGANVGRHPPWIDSHLGYDLESTPCALDCATRATDAHYIVGMLAGNLSLSEIIDVHLCRVWDTYPKLSLETLDLLVNKFGKSLYDVDPFGTTPVIQACLNGWYEGALHLLNAGAWPDRTCLDDQIMVLYAISRQSANPSSWSITKCNGASTISQGLWKNNGIQNGRDHRIRDIVYHMSMLPWCILQLILVRWRNAHLNAKPSLCLDCPKYKSAQHVLSQTMHGSISPRHQSKAIRSLLGDVIRSPPDIT